MIQLPLVFVTIAWYDGKGYCSARVPFSFISNLADPASIVSLSLPPHSKPHPTLSSMQEFSRPPRFLGLYLHFGGPSSLNQFYSALSVHRNTPQCSNLVDYVLYPRCSSSLAVLYSAYRRSFVALVTGRCCPLIYVSISTQL